MATTGKRVIVVAGFAICATGCLPFFADDEDDAVDAPVVDGPFEPDAAMVDAAPDAAVDAAIDATVDATTDAGWEGSCVAELPCPPPDAGKATVCGRIFDVESDAVVAVASPTSERCADPTTSGSCSLRMRYYDALDFAQDPTMAQLLVPEETYVDDCGRFRARNLPRATFGFIGIAVDDAPTITPAEPHRLTGVVVHNSQATPGRVRAYATRVSTDELWHTASGIGGMTFAQRGVLLKVFTYHGTPVAGVTLRRNGASVPDDDFYFSDAGITRRTVDSARTSTGPNGSVLVLGSETPIAHDGVGGEPGGCVWPAALGTSIPGVVSVDFAEPQTSGGAVCP